MARTIALYVLLLLSITTLRAQTVDEIVKLTLSFRGGEERIKAVRTQRLTGRIWVGSDAGRITVEIQRPASIREEFTAGSQKIIRVSNGSLGYIQSGNDEPQVLGMSDIKSMSASADLDGPLVDYKAKGNRIEYGGAVEIAGRKNHKLQITMKDGQQRNDYIDAQTWTETKWEGKISAGGKELMVESYFSDYRSVDGILCAFQIDSVTLGSNLKQKLIFDRIEMNPRIENSRFEKP